MLNTNSSKYSYFNPGSKLRDLSEESFNKQYINYDEVGVLESSKLLFKKKIVGLVSFFNEISGIHEATGSELFPEIKETPVEDTEVFMSDYQFSLYNKARDIERELEEISKKKGAFSQGQEVASQVEGKSANLFRVLSRQSGLFVFPPTIERPRPSDFKKKQIMDEEINEMEVNKEELRELLRQLCNTEHNPELSITIDEFNAKIASNSKQSLYFKDEILSKISFPEETETLKDKIVYICNSHKELYSDFEEDYSDETLTYLEAIDKSVLKLEDDHLKLNMVDQETNSYSLNVLSPKY